MGLFDFFKKKKTTTPAPAPKTVATPAVETKKRYTKVEIYYTGDGINTRQSVNTRQNVTKKKLLSLNKKVQDYGYSYGWNSLSIDYHQDHIIIRGGGSVLQDNDINEGSNEYIRSIVSHTWCY